MTATTDRDAILARIKKLHAMATSAANVGNAAEAETFATKVQELLTRHKLTMSAVDAAAQADDDPLGMDPFHIHRRYGGSTQPVFWQLQLASAVARAYFCDILVPTSGRAVFFIGRETDRRVAEYVYGVLIHAAFQLAGREYRIATKAGRDTHGFMASFKLAFVHTIARRYREEADRIVANEHAAGRGVALIRLDTARADVERYITQHSTGETRDAQPPRATDRYAAVLGARHGEQANIHPRGIDAGDAPQDRRPLNGGTRGALKA